MNIDELLVDFDEMGFAPTTPCENPDKYACEWKRQLLAEIDRLKIQLAQANAGIVNCIGCKLVELNAVNEFAEKLKSGLVNCTGCYIPNCFESPTDEFAYSEKDLLKLIDELLKEW